MTGHDRRALIIVVPACANDPSLDLPVVRNDASALALSLQQSAYAVTILGANDAHLVSRGAIRTSVRKACEEIGDGGTLLIFLSGHGLHVGGKNYLVPYDGDLSDVSEQTLFSIDDALLAADSSKAREIIVFVDACREGMEQYTKSLGLRRMGSGKLKNLARRNLAFVFSCQAGELSYYVPGDDGFSIFSKAFSRALARDNQARTLQQVFDAAQDYATDLSRENDRPLQRFRLIADRASDVAGTVICEGNAADPVANFDRSWHEAVTLSPLWMRGVDGDDLGSPRVAAFRERSASLAATAECAFREAAAPLSDDAWRDDRYPIRVLEQLDRLIRGGGILDLTTPEIALLASAPFVREYAYSLGVTALARAGPLSPDLPAGATMPDADSENRRRLLTTYRAHPQAMRRVASLQKTKSRRAKKAVAVTDPRARAILLWLLHRHMAKFAAMWQPPPYGTLLDLPNGSSVGAAANDEVDRVFDWPRLLKFAKCVRCETIRLRRNPSTTACDGDKPLDELTSPLEEMIVPGPGDQPIRERLIASLLCLAGWLALDTRLADIVLIDHVGIADSVEIEDFRAAVRAARWDPLWGAWRLNVSCDHPAVDFALRELVAHADRVLGELRLLLGADEKHGLLVAALPARLLADGIQPQQRLDAPAYTTPHRTFSLANHEVRELLMGEQLYGDPDLALRELYQNALDACRYRRARVQYLIQSGRRQSWAGQIGFHQGVIDGRAYIECEDNGVGMGVHELEACFARAGRRFTDLPEFIEEQDLWLQCTPKIEFWANSQFGVGVLSYFMIADEIEISTRRFQRDGRLGQRLEVSIPGSGNLFRVRPGTPDGDAGTRIRLYLRNDWRKSCCKVLEKLLVVAEFETEARNKRERIRWRPGAPRDQRRYLPTGDPDFWWDSVIGPGEVLADGLRVDTTLWRRQRDSMPRSGSVGFSGLLVNFRGRRRPRLTVDRKSLLALDRRWIEYLCSSQVQYLVDSPWLRFTWLWNISNIAKEPVRQALIRNNAFVVIGHADEFSPSNRDIGWTRKYQSALEVALGFGPGSRLGFPFREISIVPGHAISVLALAASQYIDDKSEMYSILDGFFDVRHPLPRATGVARISVDTRLRALHFDPDYKKREAAQGAAIFIGLGFPAGDWIINYLPHVKVSVRAKFISRPARWTISRLRLLYHIINIRIEREFEKRPFLRVLVEVGLPILGFALLLYFSWKWRSG